MASYYANSGSPAADVSGPLSYLANELFASAIEANRIGHLIGAKVPNVSPSTRTTFTYALKSRYVNSSENADGYRLIGQPVPQAEDGKNAFVSMDLLDYGQMAVLDHADGYSFGGDDEFLADEAGVRMSTTHLLDALDLRASEVLTDSNPWAASPVTGSDWGDDANSPLKDILGALDSHAGTAGNEDMPAGSIGLILGAKVYRSLLSNSNMTSLFGGLSGVGVLTPEQLRGALASVGVSSLFIGTDARYGNKGTLYLKPPVDSLAVTPGGRMMDTAGIITPHSGETFVHSTERVRLDARRSGYYVFANCEPCGILPEWGITINNLY